MKLLAGILIFGFLLLAALSSSPHINPDKRTCCATDNNGRLTCHMNSQGGSHACNCKTSPSFPTCSLPTGTCNGPCGQVIAPSVQSSPFLDRIRRYAVSGYRRITKGNLLEHETRHRIYDTIVSWPGVDLRTLMDLTGLNENTLRYHLGRLYDGGKIQATTIG
ncbi:MAG: hypothetical protein LUQ50_05975, partial [Methanospirillum sp.]|nr:hypothetical protein [Methanospirillum sp.]